MQQLIERVLARLGAPAPPALARRVDGKPLVVVGPHGKDRDARWACWAATAKARGYKQFVARGRGVVPDAWTLGPMNLGEPTAAARELVPRLAGGGRPAR